MIDTQGGGGWVDEGVSVRTRGRGKKVPFPRKNRETLLLNTRETGAEKGTAGNGGEKKASAICTWEEKEGIKQP